MAECRVMNCEKRHHAKGYCSTHYHYSKKTGSPERPNPLERFNSKVEKTDSCWVWKGSPDSEGYGRISVGGRSGKMVKAHRFAYENLVGSIPDGMQIDHKCHNTMCVNPEHLRAATPKQNSENLLGADFDSKTGVRGVHWSRSARKYEARVTHNGARYHVGMFMDINEAEAAVIAKRLDLFTHNEIDKHARMARTNQGENND